MLFLWRGSLVTPFVAHYVADVFQLVQAQDTHAELMSANIVQATHLNVADPQPPG